jgi:threonine/homoserine/homoserine lactone efflux protein
MRSSYAYELIRVLGALYLILLGLITLLQPRKSSASTVPAHTALIAGWLLTCTSVLRTLSTAR